MDLARKLHVQKAVLEGSQDGGQRIFRRFGVDHNLRFNVPLDVEIELRQEILV